MKTRQQVKGKASKKFLANTLTAILVAYSLLLKGVRMLKEQKQTEVSQDIVLACLKDIEPHFYISAAGLLMKATFGDEGSEVRDLADKCVIDMVRAELKMGRQE